MKLSFLVCALALVSVVYGQHKVLSPEDLDFVEMETGDRAPVSPGPAIDYDRKMHALPDPGQSIDAPYPKTRSHDGEWFAECVLVSTIIHELGVVDARGDKIECTRFKVYRLKAPYELDEFGRELIYGLVEHEKLPRFAAH